MGCGGSKVTEPVKSHMPTYHPLNKPIDEEDATKIYEILEYWFCTPYTEFDRTNHIKDLRPPQARELPAWMNPRSGTSEKSDPDQGGALGLEKRSNDKQEHTNEEQNPLEAGDENDIKEEDLIEALPCIQQPDPTPEGYWDRHSSVNSTAFTRWYMAGEDQDQEIKVRFLPLLMEIDKLLVDKPKPNSVVESASQQAQPDEAGSQAQNALEIEQSPQGPAAYPNVAAGWTSSLHGRLALAILCDQFSRTIYRKDKNAFNQDKLAQQLVKDYLTDPNNKELFLLLRPFEMVNFLMPLMHSENLLDVNLCCDTLNNIIQLSHKIEGPGKLPVDVVRFIESNLKFARDHLEILVKYGRYPHRNDILERESTKEELEFLSE